MRYTASLRRVQVNARYPIASSAEPSAPTAAASVGVARPNMIVPSTERISSASGKNEVASSFTVLKNGTSVCSLGSFGARCGFHHAIRIR